MHKNVTLTSMVSKLIENKSNSTALHFKQFHIVINQGESCLL